MIFQEPMTSLNPAFTVGDQIAEVILRHRDVTQGARGRARASRCCAACASRRPRQRFHDYPHRLSGGMRQRVMIAMALACDPALLIADEPTTALDVTIQAQILDLMRTLREETGTAIILITHDLGVVAEVADDVAVMYAGRIVERAPVARAVRRPAASVHDRPAGLDPAAPPASRTASPRSRARCPTPLAPVAGCRFHPRCPFVDRPLPREEPPLMAIRAGHDAACWRAPLPGAMKPSAKPDPQRGSSGL